MENVKLPHGKTSRDAEERRILLEKITGIKLSHVRGHTFSAEDAARNMENFIGVTQVPLGIVGPLRVNGSKANGLFYVPLATTEGALLATVNRGCSVTLLSGGVNVSVLGDIMTRAPVFRVKNIMHGNEVIAWLKGNIDTMRAAASRETSHGKLMTVKPFLSGRTLHVRLGFSTGDAMGMNMATLASEAIGAIIEKETGAKLISVSGNLCTDKKPAAINYIEGRGKTVVADALIPDSVIRERLHTEPDIFLETYYRKIMVGSAMALSFGFNSHFANMAAALFIATGQDVAQVVEASLGITTAERIDGGIYFSVLIPALEVGTVGGGTALPTQREALELMGCYGAEKAVKFAEIAAALILAGELSTLGAQSAGELASAHKRLAR